MEQFPDDYECDGQIDIWEWMEEKEHIEDGRCEVDKDSNRYFRRRKDVADREFAKCRQFDCDIVQTSLFSRKEQ